MIIAMFEQLFREQIFPYRSFNLLQEVFCKGFFILGVLFVEVKGKYTGEVLN